MARIVAALGAGLSGALLLLSLSSHGGSGQPTASSTQPSTLAVQVERALACEVFCSSEKPRTSVAVITWKASEAALQPESLSKAIAGQGLEVTVHKDGFKRGIFARLPTVQSGKRFMPLFRSQETKKLAGLDKLDVVRVETLAARRIRAPPPSRSGNEKAIERSPQEAARTVVVEVEGLDPGLNYYWRVPVTSGDTLSVSEMARCMAPVCPADFQ